MASGRGFSCCASSLQPPRRRGSIRRAVSSSRILAGRSRHRRRVARRGRRSRARARSGRRRHVRLDARFSLTELAARSAAVQLAGARRVPGTQAGAEATAARAVFDAVAAGELEYFAPVAGCPGFPKALARTLHELRLAGVAPRPICGGRHRAAARRRPPAGARRRPAAAASITDRAALFRLAARGVRRRAGAVGGAAARAPRRPLDSQRRAGVRRRARARAPAVLATVPDGDESAREALRGFGSAEVDIAEDPAAPQTRSGAPPPLSSSRRIGRRRESRAGDVRLFSAPGEGREAVEIVRRVLDEAARGVPFDEMAVFLRDAAAVSRPARARVRARRRAGVLRSRHPAARSGRPRVRRAAVVRVRGAVGEALRRIPVARPGAADPAQSRPAGSRSRPTARRGRSWPRDEVFRDGPESTRRRTHDGRSATTAVPDRAGPSTRTMRRLSPARCARRGSGKS